MQRYIFEADYGVGERVFLCAAIGRIPGFVTGVKFTPGGAQYFISWGDGTETMHWALEMTRQWQPDFGALEE